MNEGLKALERLYDNVHRNSQYYETGLCNVDFKVIEKELKDKEKFEELVNTDLDLFMKMVDIKGLIEDYQKFKQVLEIVKKKNVFVWGFIHRKEEIKDFEQTYDYYKTHYGYFHSGYKFKLLTKEEYDLLKEVLL